MKRTICLFVSLFIILSCGNNNQGENYTYSYAKYGETSFTDVSFKALNDTLAYIWSRDKFYMDEMRARALYKELDGDKSTISMFTRRFLVKKGEKLINFDDVKCRYELEEEKVAYKGARFGMSLNDVIALPGFSEWIPKSRDDNSSKAGDQSTVIPDALYYQHNLDREEYKKVNGFDVYENSNGIGQYDVTMEFNKRGELSRIEFNIKASFFGQDSKTVKERLLYFLRVNYGLSYQDRIKQDFDNNAERHEWVIGSKMIIFTNVSGVFLDDYKIILLG